MGMMLVDFCCDVDVIVVCCGFVLLVFVFGGDYFGLNLWWYCCVVDVMCEVVVMVVVYVEVGFEKIYFDVSMVCVDDLVWFDDCMIVVCVVELCCVVEDVVVCVGIVLVYVIGIEVLMLGGEVSGDVSNDVIVWIVVMCSDSIVVMFDVYCCVFFVVGFDDVWMCVVVVVV